MSLSFVFLKAALYTRIIRISYFFSNYLLNLDCASIVRIQFVIDTGENIGLETTY